MSAVQQYAHVEQKTEKFRIKNSENLLKYFQAGIDEGRFRENVTVEFIFDQIRAVLSYYVKSDKKGTEFETTLTLALKCVADGIQKKV